jgi:SAM-dependent methyltransferase
MPGDETQQVFAYSDSDEAEERILRILRGASDRSIHSAELTSQITDWVSYYHLSPQRCDLLRPLTPLLQGSVLEVGSGCGAVTRWLGETARHVTAVEGSTRRAEITRLRCEDLPAVQVVSGNLERFESEQRFDAVTCIGVIEYAALYFSGPEPWNHMLSRMARYLSPGGKLVIAIENRLGLKYFAGAPEDHTGRAYDGLQNLYTPAGVRTLGRGEWLELLDRNGLAVQSWLYPFPDYKHAGVVLTDAALARIPVAVADILGDSPAPTQNRDYERTFSEESVWPSLVRNGLVPHLTNSFLIVAGRQDDSPHPWVPSALFYKYSTNRRPAYAKELRVEDRPSGLAAVRRQLHPESPQDPEWRVVTSDEPFLHGALYASGLITILNRAGWNLAGIAAWAKRWLDLLGTASRPAPELPGAAALPERFVDCVPFNLIVEADGTLKPFDLEYAAASPLPLGHVAFRGIWGTLARVRTCAPPDNGTTLSLCELSFEILHAAGLNLDAAARAEILRREAQLRCAVLGVTQVAALETILSAHLRVRGSDSANGSDSTLCQLFWRTAGSVFQEGASASRFASLSGRLQRLLLPLPAAASPYLELRLDFADRPCLAQLDEISLLNASGEIVWPATAEDLRLADPRNAGFLQIAGGGADHPPVLLAQNNDPYCFIPLTAAQGEKLQGGGSLQIAAVYFAPKEALARTIELLAEAQTETRFVTTQKHQMEEYFRQVAAGQAAELLRLKTELEDKLRGAS